MVNEVNIVVFGGAINRSLDYLLGRVRFSHFMTDLTSSVRVSSGIPAVGLGHGEEEEEGKMRKEGEGWS